MSFLQDIFDKDQHSLTNALSETTSFSEMFSDITRLFDGERPREIEDIIINTKSVLKKNDRVAWWLRLWKIGYVDAQMRRFPEIVSEQELDKLISNYARRSRFSVNEIVSQAWSIYHDHKLLEKFGNLLSLPISSIQSHIFRFDDPEKLLSFFEKQRNKWQLEQKDSFEDPQARPILKFANGLAWYNLDKAHCDLEGKAMGHAGNKPREHTNDTILSLRETYHDADRVMVKPVLTFVLDKNGMLGEMKGRFNKHPESKYYNEIVALLRLPLITGIKGGGHDPENNFKLSDLPKDVQTSLLAEKPELGGVWSMFKAFGVKDDRVQECLIELLESESIKPSLLRLSDDGKYFVIGEFSDLYHFIDAIKDQLLDDMLSIYAGNTEEITPIQHISDEEIISIIRHLSTVEYSKLMMAMGVRAVSVKDTRYEAALRLAASRLRSSHYYQELLESVNETIKLSHGDLQKLHERIQQYINLGWSFRGRWQYPHIKKNWDSPVEMRISSHDLISMVTAGDEHDEDYLTDVYDIREARNWDSVDIDLTNEHREEYHLSTSLETDEVVHDILGTITSTFDPSHVSEVFSKKIS